MAIDLLQLRQAIAGIGKGLVDVIGQPTADAFLRPHPNGNSLISLVRDGYTVVNFDAQCKRVRRHAFSDLSGFACWLKRHASGAQTDILFEPSRVSAALAPSDEHGDIVTCSLDWHPRFHRWIDSMRGLTQAQLFDLVIASQADFREVQTADGLPMGTEGQLFADQLLQIEIVKGGSLKTTLDATGAVRFQGSSQSTTVNGKLPGRFSVSVPVYRGVDKEHELDILLRVDAPKDKSPRFHLTCPALEMVKHEALLAAAAYLRTLLPAGEDGFIVALGALRTDVVPGSL